MYVYTYGACFTFVLINSSTGIIPRRWKISFERNNVAKSLSLCLSRYILNGRYSRTLELVENGQPVDTPKISMRYAFFFLFFWRIKRNYRSEVNLTRFTDIEINSEEIESCEIIFVEFNFSMLHSQVEIHLIKSLLDNTQVFHLILRLM